MNRIAELMEISAELDRRGRFVEADQVEKMMQKEARNLIQEGLEGIGKYLETPGGMATTTGALGALGIGGILRTNREINRQLQEAGVPPEARSQVLDFWGRIDPQKVEAYKRIHGGAPINRTPFGTRPSDRNMDPVEYGRLKGFMPQQPSRRPFDERPSGPTGNI